MLGQMGVAAIRTDGLTKDYGGGRGVFDLDLQISTGETFGLLGHAESGKSTLVRLLMGMLHPTRGHAYVFGLDSLREAVEIKRRTGHVPDPAADFGLMRGAEVVAYLAGLRGGVHEDRVRELAERFDLDLGRRHLDYGSGDRQKLSIVLAFMHEPQLLILDEPANDLDDRAASELQALIDEARDAGKTILLGLRRAVDVHRHCDVVGILRHGKLSSVTRIEDMAVELEEQNPKALPP